MVAPVGSDILVIDGELDDVGNRFGKPLGCCDCSSADGRMDCTALDGTGDVVGTCVVGAADGDVDGVPSSSSTPS